MQIRAGGADIQAINTRAGLGGPAGNAGKLLEREPTIVVRRGVGTQLPTDGLLISACLLVRQRVRMCAVMAGASRSRNPAGMLDERLGGAQVRPHAARCAKGWLCSHQAPSAAA